MQSDLEIVKKYVSLSHSAESRNIQFNISFSEFKKIYNTKKCYYTGVRLVHNHNFSFDRVDNSKGYISGNIVACDKAFNSLKTNLTLEQINLLYNRINQFYHKYDTK